jgi:hypothetical protein
MIIPAQKNAASINAALPAMGATAFNVFCTLGAKLQFAL